MNRNGIRNRWASIAALGALCMTLPACAYLVGSWAGAPTADARRDNIIFSHNRHVVKESLSCSDCHGKVEANESVQETRMIPKEKQCLECHDREDNCKQCHANPSAPTTLVDHRMPGIRFSHKNHIERKVPGTDQFGCDVCHGALREATHVSDDKRPSMLQTCGLCHKTTFRKEKCSQCHISGSLSERTSDDIFDHGGDWLRRHGQNARGGDAICLHCHKTETCAECHSRSNIPIRPSQLNLDRPEMAVQHRGDWLSRHNIEARLDGKSCLTCHEQRTCTECHQRLGVAAAAKLGGSNNPHPAGWINRGSGTFHGDEARRDAFACAVCHDRGAVSNCVSCHRVGAPGGNPHPGGWRSDENKHTSPACAPCHS